MKELAYTQEAKPLVSVIMPSYNAEKYIKEAIESVIAQTYKNWELFVIDDGSTDRTAEIARSYAEKDSRIILHRNSHNMGTAKTRNTGIKLANGEWIATLDSDDMWHLEKLEIQLKKAAKTGSLSLYTSYSLFCEGFRQEYTVPEKIDYSSLLTENVIGCSTVMMNRSILEKHLLPSDKLNIVTVARFGKEKGVLRTIRAVSKLEKKDLLKYYIIGDGTEFEQAKALVDELKLSENVTLLGEKENPYGYIKAADLLLIPSYSEAAPMVIGEAACLGVPVLSTETSSSEEMVVATGYGFVCKNSQDGITHALEEIINNQNLIKEKSSFLNSQKFSNANALKQFSELVK